MNSTMKLKYTGSAVDAGEMGVSEVAQNMVAFSNFVAATAKVKYGSDVRIDGNVRGFSKGSFITEFAFIFGGSVSSLLGTATIADVISLIVIAVSVVSRILSK